MAIERNQPWGMPGTMEADVAVATSDAMLAQLAAGGATHLRPAAGDLARTLGVTSRSVRHPVTMLLPCDLIEVTLDHDTTLLAAAHVVTGPRLWPQVFVMNAAFVGAANVAPKAHPGDGRLDIVTFDLGLTDRIKARSRMRTGSHVPHPQIHLHRGATWERDFGTPTRVVIDGSEVRRARHLRCSVDAERVVLGV